MKRMLTLLPLVLLLGCTDEWRKTTLQGQLQGELIKECGKDDPECATSVKRQLGDCMEKADWRTFDQNRDDKAVRRKFMRKIANCIVSPHGNTYFELRSDRDDWQGQ